MPFRKAATERSVGERGKKRERKEERGKKERREGGRKEQKKIKKNLKQVGRGSSLANHGNQGLF